MARSFLIALLALLISMEAFAEWPERPITLVVMYAPGGGTDTILRTLANEMSNATGWRINVVNRPGAAGALATQYVLNRNNDGYTLLGASNFNKYARISGGGNSRSWEDWYYMQAALNIGSWAVLPSSPFRNLDDVITAARDRPGEVTISTSGTGGQWHEDAAAVAKLLGIKLRYIPYGSGRAATLAALNGEVAIAGGGVHEHIQFIDAGQLSPLMQTSSNDILTSRNINIPSLYNIIPLQENLLPPNGSYNLGVRRDTPIDIIRKIEEAFLLAINTESFKNVLRVRNFIDISLMGDMADRRAAELEVISATNFAELEIPEARSPEDLGLPTPEKFIEWWPPDTYKPLSD
jgi:tripartite-type tricarboxylate transporter receptor subunit TctC